MALRIFHFEQHSGHRNFGDDLNLWLWPKLRPNLFGGAKESDPLFLGMGTLLNERVVNKLKHAPIKIVFGSGYGYTDKDCRLDQSWRVVCVRGPVTAAALGLSKDFAVADPGILVSRVRTASPKSDRVAFMPHIAQAISAGQYWKAIVEDLGFLYIDPRDEIEQILDAISGSSMLLTEALHGAIVADAFRTPWIPLKSHSGILETKWRDWCLSMNLEYSPMRIPAIWPQPQADSRMESINPFRKGLKLTLAMRALRRIKGVKPQISNLTTISLKTERLVALLDTL